MCVEIEIHAILMKNVEHRVQRSLLLYKDVLVRLLNLHRDNKS